MPSILPGYEYDIFISYRQNDNKRDGWVTEFVKALQDELDATVKEKVSIYFDENPHDGIAETHDVDDSLAKKLKCLIFIPIISKTYCDPNGFAWTNEFLAFNELEADEFGLKVDLLNGNTASRILPIRIHDISESDKQLVENEIGILRSIDFVFSSSGVNRPLLAEDNKEENRYGTRYRDQINKVANSIEEIIEGIKGGSHPKEKQDAPLSIKNKSTPIKPVKKNKKGILIGIITVLVIATVSYFLISNNSETAITEEIDKSIAVLPFDNLSDDKEKQYFADGVMEDILTQLQRMGELRVTSRTSVETYRDTDKKAPEIGQELNVSYLLEGSVRKAGNQIMITAQLIRTKDDSHIWADNFTSEYTTEGLFDIQRKIAESIVGELKLKISPEKVAEITQMQTENKEAYEHFIEGRRLYDQGVKASYELAIEQFRQAIDLDPLYARAYGQLSNSFYQAVRHGRTDNWLDSSRVYAEKGIELDPNCAECYKALGMLVDDNHQAALDYFEKARSINPNYVNAVSHCTLWYIQNGDFELGLDGIETLISLGADNSSNHLLNLYELMSDYEKAAEYGEKSEKLNNGWISLRWFEGVLIKLKNIDRFRENFTDIFEISADSSLLYTAKLMEFWMEDKYAELIQYYEDNQDKRLDVRWDTRSKIMLSYFVIKNPKAAQIAEIYINWTLDTHSRDASLMNNIELFRVSEAYAVLGNNRQALYYLGKAIDKGWCEDLFQSLAFESLVDKPSFKEMVEKQKRKREEVMALIATYNFPEPEDL